MHYMWFTHNGFMYVLHVYLLLQYSATTKHIIAYCNICNFHMYMYVCRCNRFPLSGSAPVTNGMATVTIYELKCNTRYSIVAGGTLEGGLLGPKSAHGNITTSSCVGKNRMYKILTCLMSYVCIIYMHDKNMAKWQANHFMRIVNWNFVMLWFAVKKESWFVSRFSQFLNNLGHNHSHFCFLGHTTFYIKSIFLSPCLYA